jgi:hypothetical protein
MVEQAECNQCLRERAVFSERIEGGSSSVVPFAAPKVECFSKKAQADKFVIQDGQVEAAWSARPLPSPDHDRG